jgi:fluoroquinolone resistance protein
MNFLFFFLFSFSIYSNNTQIFLPNEIFHVIFNIITKDSDWNYEEICCWRSVSKQFNEIALINIRENFFINYDDHVFKKFKNIVFIYNFNKKNNQLNYGLIRGSNYIKWPLLRKNNIFLNKNLFSLDLSFSNFQNTNFTNSRLQHVILKGCCFKDCIFENVDFTQALLNNSFYENCVFNMSHLDNAYLNNTMFFNCSFKKACFYGASCVETAFIDCDLTDTNFADSDLKNAKFNGSIAVRSCFTENISQKQILSFKSLDKAGILLDSLFSKIITILCNQPAGLLIEEITNNKGEFMRTYREMSTEEENYFSNKIE